MANTPELQSVVAFLEFLREDDRTTFTHDELRELARNEQRSTHKLREQLAVEGYELARRPHEAHTRGFTANDHNRWQSFPSHGGSGIDSRSGVAGEF
jgi:hypothetical protein